jgi:hypothetical protein
MKFLITVAIDNRIHQQIVETPIGAPIAKAGSPTKESQAFQLAVFDGRLSGKFTRTMTRLVNFYIARDGIHKAREAFHAAGFDMDIREWHDAPLQPGEIMPSKEFIVDGTPPLPPMRIPRCNHDIGQVTDAIHSFMMLNNWETSLKGITAAMVAFTADDWWFAHHEVGPMVAKRFNVPYLLSTKPPAIDEGGKHERGRVTECVVNYIQHNYTSYDIDTVRRVMEMFAEGGWVFSNIAVGPMVASLLGIKI